MKNFLIVIAFCCIGFAILIAILLADVCYNGGYSTGIAMIGFPNVLKLLAVGGVLLWLAKEPE